MLARGGDGASEEDLEDANAALSAIETMADEAAVELGGIDTNSVEVLREALKEALEDFRAIAQRAGAEA